MGSTRAPLFVNAISLWTQTVAFCLRGPLAVVFKLNSAAAGGVGEVARGAMGFSRDFSGGCKNTDKAFEKSPMLLCMLGFTLGYHKGICGGILCSCYCIHFSFFLFYL